MTMAVYTFWAILDTPIFQPFGSAAIPYIICRTISLLSGSYISCYIICDKCAALHCREMHGPSDQPAEPVMAHQCSDDNGSAAVSSNANSASESAHPGRRSSNSAESEPCASVESASVEPTKMSGGRRPVSRRTER